MFATNYQDSVKEKSYSSDLTWDQWLEIKPLLPIATVGRPITLPLKDVIDGIFYVTKNSCNWADLPHDFPDYRRVNEWYKKWQDNGTWDRILHHVRERVRTAAGREATPSEGCIDSQTVKAAATGGERGYDGGKKMNGRKRHILVDTMGLLLAVVVTAGNVPDAEGAEKLLRRLGQTSFPQLRRLHVDSSYNRPHLHAYAKERDQYELIFRKKPQGAREFIPVKKRWVVERTFGWFGQYRRLVRDYERDERSSETMIKVSMIHLMLKRKLYKGKPESSKSAISKAA